MKQVLSEGSWLARVGGWLASPGLVVGAGGVSAVGGILIGALWLADQQRVWRDFAFLGYPVLVRHVLSIVAVTTALSAAFLLARALRRNAVLEGFALKVYWSALGVLWLALIAMGLMPVDVPNLFN